MATEPPCAPPPVYTEKKEDEQKSVQPAAAQPLPPPGYGMYPQGVPMQYIAMPVAVPDAETMKPPHPPPHTFFILALIMTIICGLVNIVSLAFGIPAVVYAGMSVVAKRSGDYPKAEKYGYQALIMTICNVLLALILSFLIIAVVMSLYDGRTDCNQLQISLSYDSRLYCY